MQLVRLLAVAVALGLIAHIVLCAYDNGKFLAVLGYFYAKGYVSALMLACKLAVYVDKAMPVYCAEVEKFSLTYHASGKSNLLSVPNHRHKILISDT